MRKQGEVSNYENGGSAGGNAPAVIDGSTPSNSTGQSTVPGIDFRTFDQGTELTGPSPRRLRPSALPWTVDASGRTALSHRNAQKERSSFRNADRELSPARISGPVHWKYCRRVRKVFR